MKKRTMLSSNSQNDPPKGIHVILDLCNLDWGLCTDSGIWLSAFEAIARTLNMDVMAKAEKIFQPPREPGLTAYVMLDASHFSVHTYAYWGLAAVDMFACKQKSLAQGVQILCKSLSLEERNINSKIEFGRFGTQDIVMRSVG